MSKKWIFAVAATMMLASATFGQVQHSSLTAQMRNLEIFNSLFNELITNYVDTIDSKKAIETAINAMLQDMDPYTEYISADQVKDFSTISTGEYGGVGSTIMKGRDGRVALAYVYENSPAYRAGLRSGDVLLTIDGDTVTHLATDSVSQRLRGNASTDIRVKVMRPWTQDSIREFTFKREIIKLNPITYYGVQRGSIGYIALNTYNEHSADSVKKALLEFKANPAVRSIVLDLRGNGGGLVESAVQIVGMFVPKGTTVLETKGKDKDQVKTYRTTEQPLLPDIPLVVLVDEGSASSSEITAGALQDMDRAVIVGRRSYGKGLVQLTRPLPYDGVLKVTIAKYYIPSGRLIQEIDYSNRNAEGEAQRIPDSLTHVFYTVNGRPVRDGGGITPDFVVKEDTTNRLVYNVVRDHWDFNFATRYVAEHPDIATPDKFVVTDQMYEQFKRSIDPKKFDYDKVCETGLDALRRLAEREGYINDSTTAAFDHLGKLLRHDLNHDLDVNRKKLEGYIAQEILMKRYFERGAWQHALRIDPMMDQAEKVLTTEGLYTKTLAGEKKAKVQEKNKTKKRK